MESNWKTQSRIRFGYPKSNSIIRILKKNEFESELANSSQHYGLILAKFEFKSGYFSNLINCLFGYENPIREFRKFEFKPEFMNSLLRCHIKRRERKKSFKYGLKISQLSAVLCSTSLQKVLFTESSSFLFVKS